MAPLLREPTLFQELPVPTMYNRAPMDDLRRRLRICQHEGRDPIRIQRLQRAGSKKLAEEIKKQLKRAVELLNDEAVEYKRAKVLNLLPEFLESSPESQLGYPSEPTAHPSLHSLQPFPAAACDNVLDTSLALQACCDLECGPTAGVSDCVDLYRTPIRDPKAEVTPAKTPSKNLFSGPLFGSPTPLKRSLLGTPECFSPWNNLDFSPFLTSHSKDISVHQLLQFTPQKLCFEEQSPLHDKLDTNSDSLGTLDSKLSSPPSVVKARASFMDPTGRPPSPLPLIEHTSPSSILFSCRSPNKLPCPDLFVPPSEQPATLNSGQPGGGKHTESQRSLVADLENLPGWSQVQRVVPLPVDRPSFQHVPENPEPSGLTPPAPVLKHEQTHSTDNAITPWTRSSVLSSYNCNSSAGAPVPGHVQLSPLQFSLDLFDPAYGGGC